MDDHPPWQSCDQLQGTICCLLYGPSYKSQTPSCFALISARSQTCEKLHDKRHRESEFSCLTCWQDSALDSLVAARHAVLADLAADLAGGQPGGCSADAGTPMGHQVVYLITYMSQKGDISTGIEPFSHQATPMRHEGILLIMPCILRR